jgi:hypothetical protein
LDGHTPALTESFTHVFWVNLKGLTRFIEKGYWLGHNLTSPLHPTISGSTIALDMSNPIIWKTAGKKALRSLPVYVAIALSIVFAMQVVAYLVGGHTFSARTYQQALALALVSWVVRQFIRFWFTVFLASRQPRY